jgi:hypothetical protein
VAAWLSAGKRNRSSFSDRSVFASNTGAFAIDRLVVAQLLSATMNISMIILVGRRMGKAV